MEFIIVLAVLLFVGNHLTHGALVAIGKNFLSEPSKPKALGTSLDPHDCEVYDERLVDLKMVKAGLMRPSEVAQCDNNRCPNCK